MAMPIGTEIPPFIHPENKRVVFPEREVSLSQEIDDVFAQLRVETKPLQATAETSLLEGLDSKTFSKDTQLALAWARSSLKIIAKNGDAVTEEAKERLKDLRENRGTEEEIRSPEKLTAPEYIKRFAAYREAVHNTILDAFRDDPKRQEEEIARRVIEETLEGEPHDECPELGEEKAELSSFRPLVMSFKESDASGIYKPAVREQDYLPVKDEQGQDIGLFKVRKGVDAGTFYKRAAFTSVIDRLYGLGVVPVTIIREGPEGIGSVQEFRDAEPARGPSWVERANPQSVEAIAALHRLTGHLDGWFGNTLLKGDEAAVVDHDLVFSKQLTEDGKTGDQSRSDALEALKGKAVSDALRKKIRAVLDTPELSRLLREGFDLAFSGETMPDGSPAPQALYDQHVQWAQSLSPENPKEEVTFPQPGYSLFEVYQARGIS